MMDKDKYLDKLRARLENLPLSELGKTLKRYEDAFEAAGEANEQDLIERLGSPKELARNIEEDYFEKNPIYGVIPKNKKNYDNENSSHTGLRVALLIIFFFLWIPLTAVAYILWAAFVAGGVGIVAMGFMYMVAGTFVLTSSVPTTLFFAGIGFIMMALGILLFMAGIVLIRLTAKLLARMFGKKKRGAAYE